MRNCSIGIELHNPLKNLIRLIWAEEFEWFVETHEFVAILRQLGFLEIKGQSFRTRWTTRPDDLRGFFIHRNEGVSIQKQRTLNQGDGFALGNFVGDDNGEFRTCEIGITDEAFAGEFLIRHEDLVDGGMGKLDGDRLLR